MDLRLLSEMCAQSLTLRGKSAQPKSWLRVLKMGRFPRLQFGRISQPSQRATWLEWLTSFSGGSPASRSVSPASGKASGTNGSSGRTSSGSWKPVDPPWSFSKTCHHLFPEATSERSERDYRYWVIESKDLYSYERPMLVRRTGGSGCSSWPTPTKQEYKRRGPGSSQQGPTNITDTWEDAESRGNHPGAVGEWATPTSHERTHDPRQVDHGEQLANQVDLWYTPNGGRHVKGSEQRLKQGSNDSIESQAKLWQTPATDSFRSRSGDRKDEMGLDRQSRFWPTPVSFDATGTERSPEALAIAKTKGGCANLREVVSSHPDQPTTKPGASCWCGDPGCDRPSHKRRLNPYFVEALMGFRPGWTSRTVRTGSAPSETPSARSRERRPLSSCSEE